MGDISNELVPYNPNKNDKNNGSEATVGLRYRGDGDNGLRIRQPSLLTETYSDEICYSASIEYVDDADGNTIIPVFVTKQGNKVYIPPSIADLLRDKPPEVCSGGSECEDEEAGETKRKKKRRDPSQGLGLGDDSDHSLDTDSIKIGISGEAPDDSLIENEENEELGLIRIHQTIRKDSTDSFDFFDTDMLVSLWTQFKNVGPKLVPFLKTLGLYFVIFIPDDRPSLLAMMIKCLPIVSLALFIVLHGVGRGEEHKFSRRILTGLVFSCLGDAFLIWPEYFLHGMGAFGLAQFFYIRAFGFKPFSLKTGLAVYAFSGSSLVLILPALMEDEIPMLVGVLSYSFLLSTMLWRAVARLFHSPSTDETANSKIQMSTRWSKVSACLGALFFVVSDTILALNQFYTRVPYQQTLIMVTYYFAQLAIALSVVTTKQPKSEEESPLFNDSSVDDVQNTIGLGSKERLRQRKAKTAI